MGRVKEEKYAGDERILTVQYLLLPWKWGQSWKMMASLRIWAVTDAAIKLANGLQDVSLDLLPPLWSIVTR